MSALMNSSRSLKPPTAVRNIEARHRLSNTARLASQRDTARIAEDLQSWGRNSRRSPHPGGTPDALRCSIPDVSLIILDAVGFQERDVLLLERPLPMVFFLIPNVSNCIVHLSDPNAEGSVPFLPFEAPMRTELIVDPFRRTTLDQPHCF